MKLMVSACLLGLPCRYDGASKPYPQMAALAEQHTLVPVCPEQMGGLPTPRPPAEQQGDRVINTDGIDVTDAYTRGAEQCLQLCRLLGCDGALLKENSPSCGKDHIYDGTFTKRLVAGQGVTARHLTAAGIEVYGESDIPTLLEKE